MKLTNFLFLVVMVLPGLKNTTNEIKSCPINYRGSFNFSDTSLLIPNYQGSILVEFKYPEKQYVKGVILVLPGWKLPVSDWCTKTSLCDKAKQMGYILIMPEMAKSIYAQKRYTETRTDWLQYATREWVMDTLIVKIQNAFNLLKPGGNNFILGLSTGARGVALLCLDKPEIFKKAAGLSGDYDQTQMLTDNLMKGWYGEYSKYPERWKGSDNVVLRAKEWKTPIYLAHGNADKIVPVTQTVEFADTLKKYHPGLLRVNIKENAGHDYEFWNSQIDEVLQFFNQ